MQDILSGEIMINKNKYPYILKNRCIELIGEGLYSSSSTIFIPKELYGTTNNGNTVVFLLNEEENYSIFKTIRHIYVLGYAILKKKYDVLYFDELSFTSNALQTLYPSQNAMQYELLPNRDKWDGSIKLKTSSFKESSKKYYCINKEQDISVNFLRKIIFNSQNILVISPLLNVKNRKIKSADALIDAWLDVYDFLCFLNFRKDIVFDKVIIMKEDIKIGELIIFNSYDSNTFNSKCFQSISISDIPDDCFAKLYEFIVSIRYSDMDNYHFIPESKQDDKYIDNSKWAMNALSFEIIFEKEFKDFKSKNNDLFNETKTALLKFLSEYKVGANNKQKNYVKQFENTISHEGRLEEKFSYFISEHMSELNETIKLLSECYGLSKNLGELYAGKRNAVMHGKLEKPNKADIGIYKLIRAMFYVYILKKSGFPTEKTADIVYRMFANYN